MKKTRDIIDNGKKIIHLNYTKKEKAAKEKAYEEKIEKIREENMKRIEAERKKVEEEQK